MGMTPTVKTVSSLSLKFPVYGMLNENVKTALFVVINEASIISLSLWLSPLCPLGQCVIMILFYSTNQINSSFRGIYVRM